MTPSRVAYVVHVFPKLSETFIAGELAELRRRGIELRVLSLRRPAEGLRHGIIARSGLDRMTCYNPEEFPSVLRQFKPQWLHAHFATEPAAAARGLAEALDLPFTFTAHGYDIRRKPPPDFAERAAAARALITVSQANARDIARGFGVSPGHIRVIPCGVDTDRFRPSKSAGRARGRASTLPLLVCVSRHVPVKNLGLLLEACALLRHRGVRFRCVLVGDGPQRGDLERESQRLGLNKTVMFAGALEQAQVLRWWQRASAAVLTSESEGMPVCLMEAAACGVPAVATAVGGVPELIEDDVTGLLARAGDAADLAVLLQRLLLDPALAARMGAAARRLAEERFSVRKQVDALLALWSELMAGKGGR
jgi:glycosyltransferase involved in cell wall biosynthesis